MAVAKLTRKDRRKSERKAKKVKKALNYAKRNHTNKVCISQEEIANLKKNPSYKSFDLNMGSRTLSNGNNSYNAKPNDKKFVSKKRKKVKRNVSDPKRENGSLHNESASDGGLKMSVASSARFAKLQEFVEQESHKNKSKSRKDENGRNSKPNNNNAKLIKDKEKLKDLQQGLKEDQKEINKLARSLRLVKGQKDKICPLYFDDFGDILNDIETGSMPQNNERNAVYDSDENFEKDFLSAIGKKKLRSISARNLSKSYKNGVKEESDSDFESDNGYHGDGDSDHENAVSVYDISDNDNQNDSENGKAVSTSDKNYQNIENGNNVSSSDISDNNDSDHENIVGSSDISDNDVDEVDENDEPKCQENFFDDEAIEDDKENDSDENEVNSENENKEEIIFEGGSSLTKTSHPMSSVSINSIFDGYSSGSDELDEDLDGFVVDNDYVEFESDCSEELEEISVNKKSDLGRKKATQASRFKRLVIEDDSENEEIKLSSPIKMQEHLKVSKTIVSEESESEIEVERTKNPIKKITKTDNDKEIHKNKKKKMRLKGSEDINNKKRELDNADKPIKSKKTKFDNKIVAKAAEIESNEFDAENKENENANKNKVEKKKLKNSSLLKDSTKNNKVENSKKNENKKVSSILVRNKGKTDKKNHGKRVSFSIDTEISDQDNTQNTNKLSEDIYGRLRDKDGNIINGDTHTNNSEDGKYIPPALRKLMALNQSEKKKEQLRELKRQLKGLLNRLAESNIAGIANQVESHYHKYSKNDMNETLTKLLFEALVMPVLTPERFIQEHALLIAVLSANVGCEVGAHVLTEFTLKWVEELDQSTSCHVQAKELDNLTMVICHLYNFRIVDAALIYDLLLKILERSLGEKEIDLILAILRSVGFGLRKDDPISLKNIISKIQAEVSRTESFMEEHNLTRVQFMLEILTAIRNNNVTKVPQYDPSHVLHLKTIMKGLIRKGCRTPDLKVSLSDLVKSKVVGKWWIVGSAWSGGLKERKVDNETSNADGEESTGNVKSVSKFSLSGELSPMFQNKAKKLHMTRYPRINIFYALTEGSDSFEESAEKIIELRLPDQQEKEIFEVMIYILLRCIEYTDFYHLVALKLCQMKKKLRQLLKFALWDKFKELASMKSAHSTNLAKFVADLISENVLDLSILKSVDFTEADDKTISFVRQVIISILLNPSGTYTVKRTFDTICANSKFKAFRQYIRVFIIKFVNPKKSEGKELKLLKSRVKMVLDLLNSVAGVRL